MTKASSESWPQRHTEVDATAPGGGKMRWTVDLEPFAGCCISVDEESVREGGDVYEADKLLLDLEAAEWLVGRLAAAVAHVKAVRAGGIIERLGVDGAEWFCESSEDGETECFDGPPPWCTDPSQAFKMRELPVRCETKNRVAGNVVCVEERFGGREAGCWRVVGKEGSR